MTLSIPYTFTGGTAAASAEVNSNFSTLYNELNGTTNNSIGVKCPIGTVVAWLKSYTSTPALPDGWHECDGGTVSDAASPYNGQALPNLNTGTQRFLRGSSTSGTTGGAESHSHSSPAGGGGGGFQAASGGPTTDANHLPPYYQVVWIMRIK